MQHICRYQGCKVKGRRIYHPPTLLENGKWRVDYADGTWELFATEPRTAHF